MIVYSILRPQIGSEILISRLVMRGFLPVAAVLVAPSGRAAMGNDAPLLPRGNSA